MRSRSRRQRRKHSKALLFINVLLIILVAFSALFFFTDIFDNMIKRAPKVTVEISSEQIENGIKLETETKESKTFTSYVSYPITNKEEIDLAIHQWVTEQEDLFYEEMEQTEILLGKDFQAHFKIQSEINTVTEDIMSFKLEAEQSIETDNEYAISQPFVVDIASDNIIKLTDLFKKNEVENNGLYLIIKDKLGQENKIDDALLKSYLSNSDDIKWTLHESHITLYFNQQELSKDNEALTIDIPLLDVYKLAEAGKYEQLVITEEVQAEIERIAAEEEEARKQAEREKELKTNGKYVALTFDDGPSSNVTPRVLDTLKQYDAKATFYMLGQNAEHFPEIARRVADEGHEVANHTITHANLTAVSADRVKKEMLDSLDQIEKATDIRPKTFRPPYGNYNQTVIDNAIATDQAVIMWSVDTLDWQSRNANAIFEKVKHNTRSGSIVLMHDIHSTTADALPQIMEYLTEQGFEFVTVSELMPLLDEEGAGPYYGK